MAKKENRHAKLVSASANIEAPYELPEGWTWCQLGDVCKFENGYAFKSDKFTTSGIPVIRITNIKDNEIDLATCVYTSETDIEERFVVKTGDLLIAMSGATTGKNGVYLYDKTVYLNQRVGNIKVINPNILNDKYRNFYIQSKEQEILKNAYGGAQPNISSNKICEMLFPLPPTLAEQQRIVNRIETMFAKLDQAQEKAQSVLDSFETRKAAILHKAFTGQLRIDNEELTIEDWEETTIGECCKLGSGGTPSKSHPEYYENGDIPWLKTGEIDWNDIYDVEEKITNEGVENSSAKIFPAESVVVAMYGMGVTRGKAAIIKIPTTTNQAVCVLQPNEKLNNRFLFYYFMCNYWQIREQSVGGNQLNLSGKIIASFPIKLPPLNYQLSIVNFLDTVLEKETRAKEAAQTVLDQIALLKKSILARAFRGEL